MKKKLIVCTTFVIILLMLLPTQPANACGRKRKEKDKVTIIRDNYGVPHIFANTKEGLAFGAGYAIGQDRLWQADLFRKQAFGNLFEFGIGSYNNDYITRSLGYSREELGEIWDNWEPSFPGKKLKEMIVAYKDGLNLYIAEANEALMNGDPSLMPAEYLAYGFPLEPWTIEDSVALFVMMAWRFGATGGNELTYASRYEALESVYGPDLAWEIFNDLYPQQDPGAEVTIPSGASYPDLKGYGSKPSHLPSNIGNIAQCYEEFRMGQDEFFDSMGLPTKFGSNAWMVNPWKSVSRNAMQVGGPQMGHSTPQIVSEIGFHGAGIDAVGMMMPMAPTILIGVSKDGAWTSTTGSSDLVDTYIEELNPANQYQYKYNGEWVDMEQRTETIYGPFKTNPVDYTIYRTVHGPLIHPVYGWDLANNRAYTMKVPFYKDELTAEEGWMLFQQAENLYDMQEAAKRVDLSHNFYWIDRCGNIAYWHSGKYPIKPTYGKDFGDGPRLIDDRFPLYGTGEEEWIGLTGFKEMPKAVNPTQGYMANWNNKPIANWPYSEADWGEGHRVKWIQEVLAAGDKFTFEDMNRINMEAGYNHIAGMNFLHYLVEAAGTSDDQEIKDVFPYLEAWNHHYNDEIAPIYPDPDATYDDPGLTIFDAWYNRIFDEVFDELAVNGNPSTLIHVFDGANSKLPLNFDYLNGEDRNVVINRALKMAIADLKATRGDDIDEWLTPVIIVKLNSLGALPTPTMHYMNRGTYNHIAEMPKYSWRHWFQKSTPHAVNVIPPGQSGFFSALTGPSPHAYDQLPLYDTWTYKPVLFRFSDIKRVAESVWRYNLWL
ncbi:MAG: penicillin acylase family protein [Candidatus Lokiarchaeota archaeon]|nr:penicillin acylase family protein [Candidatus Lokiarchaeota archaeon]